MVLTGIGPLRYVPLVSLLGNVTNCWVPSGYATPPECGADAVFSILRVFLFYATFFVPFLLSISMCSLCCTPRCSVPSGSRLLPVQLDVRNRSKWLQWRSFLRSVRVL